MKTRCIFALVLALFSFGFAHGAKGPAVTDPAKAAEDPDFSVQGEYAASAAIGAKAKPGGYGLQVVALGDGAFQAALYAGGRSRRVRGDHRLRRAAVRLRGRRARVRRRDL